MTFKVITTARVPDMDDGDYTADFVEVGTTFTMEGVVRAERVPVERAWVESGVLHMEGTIVARLRSVRHLPYVADIGNRGRRMLKRMRRP